MAGTVPVVRRLDIGSGSVIAHHYRRHRQQEFLRFLKLIDAALPKNLDLHLVLDDYATHKTPSATTFGGSAWNGAGQGGLFESPGFGPGNHS